MKTNFWLGALFGAGVLLSLWDARFWFPVVLIVLLALWENIIPAPARKMRPKAGRYSKSFVKMSNILTMSGWSTKS